MTSKAPAATADSETASAVGVMRGKKRIITVGMLPALIELVDQSAARLNISRAAFLNLAITEKIEKLQRDV